MGMGMGMGMVSHEATESTEDGASGGRFCDGMNRMNRMGKGMGKGRISPSSVFVCVHLRLGQGEGTADPPPLKLWRTSQR